jgi:uncharacterized protein (DUF302 family)
MKTNPLRFIRVGWSILLLASLLFSATGWAADNPAFWKYQAKGDFAEVLSHLKHGLEAAQFQITQEENLSKGLENNKHLFPEGKWNTIGFDNVTSVHFCSIVFNQEVFNIDLDWSIFCPFKLVAYTTTKAPKDVTIVLIKPTYILEKDMNKKARDVAQRIENRIIDAIKEGLSH